MGQAPRDETPMADLDRVVILYVVWDSARAQLSQESAVPFVSVRSVRTRGSVSVTSAR
jgi:hypothetical protein